MDSRFRGNDGGARNNGNAHRALHSLESPLTGIITGQGQAHSVSSIQ
jgi:hypothetical protein